MSSARVLVAAIAVYLLALSAGVSVFLIFKDSLLDLHARFRWTIAARRWTIDRESALLVRFRVHRICKSAIAGLRTRLWREWLLLTSFRGRYDSREPAEGERVAAIQRATGGPRELKPAQREALRALEREPRASLTRREYERVTGVGRSQAAYDLSELASTGRLVRVGAGPSTRYVLAHRPAAQRRWTSDRIRRELETFCANRSAWPTAAEFKAAGYGDLYVAASRYGGITHWVNELGLDRGGRERPGAAPSLSRRSRLAWALAGALTGVVLAAAAATAIVAKRDFGSSGNTAVTRSAEPRSASRVLHPLWHPPRVLPRVSSPSPPRAANRDQLRSARSVHRTGPPALTQQTRFVSNTLQTRSTPIAPAAEVTPAAAAPQSDGPTPLPAPPGASAPTPMKAPTR